MEIPPPRIGAIKGTKKADPVATGIILISFSPDINILSSVTNLSPVQIR